jgi:hypothetical protein
MDQLFQNTQLYRREVRFGGCGFSIPWKVHKSAQKPAPRDF